MPLNDSRHLLALDDDELEELIKKWIVRLIAAREEYVDFDRPTASADQGRDSVGFLTHKRYDGQWDNYQCKHLKKALAFKDFLVEIGKIFYYAERGDYVLPRRYIFVAPNSAVGDVLRLIDRPSKIAPALLNGWDEHCLKGITKSGATLTPGIRQAINKFQFQNVQLWKITDIIEQDQMRGLLVEELGYDPGAAPSLRDEDIPPLPGKDETGYLSQLIEVFGAHRGQKFADHDEVMLDTDYAKKITRARRQFLERKAFRRHFRDNIDNELLDRVDVDVLDGVQDRYDSHEISSLYKRLLAVIEHAAGVEVSGPLGKHRRVTPSVKQGACHHHASTGSMPLRWDR